MALQLPAKGADVTVSVVSHGHDDWLIALLDGLARTSAGCVRRVVLTHNVPVRNGILGEWPFELVQIHNATPQGFGANHNQAFAHAASAYFCVLNPDMELSDAGLWPSVLTALAEPGVGAVAPTLINRDGSQQDHGRALVTPWALVRRRLFGAHDARIDWFSASFLVLAAHVYSELGGFDDRYHMYCEDVDFCLRLQLAGYRLVRADATAVHHAQRASLRHWRPLTWHLRSLWRLWRSDTYRDYLTWRADASHGAVLPKDAIQAAETADRSRGVSQR